MSPESSKQSWSTWLANVYQVVVDYQYLYLNYLDNPQI